MTTIIDYGMGNVASLQNMIRKIGGEAHVENNGDRIYKAGKLILPGVGAFDNAMSKLAELGLIEILNQKVLVEKIPILCICLGCQLITQQSEEGSLRGLGWIDAETKRFQFPKDSQLRVPHMGWNRVNIRKTSPIFQGFEDDPRFYFVHSYHLVCNDDTDIIGMTSYGYEFIAAVQRDNIYGTQFHPEKSHRYGLSLIKNFIEL